MGHNILLIQVDQMHHACLSLLGHPAVRTENLDRLAREGLLFRRATANSPICMPSRVSMLSGQYCSTLRQYGFSGLCDARTPWIQGAFKRAGYRTGAFGKLHVLCVGQEQWEFDSCAPSMPEDPDLARPLGNDYMTYCRRHGVPWPTDQIHGHNPYGPNSGNPSSATADMNWARKRSCKSEVPLEHSLETWTTNQCIEFIRGCAAADAPFFAWLTYDRPHSPTTLPEPWFSRVRPDRVPLQPLPDARQWTRLPPSWFHDFTRNASVALMGEADFRFTLATYFTCIEWIDAEIGRVLRALKDLGQADNTTIVFTADHGDEAGWHGLYDKGRGLSSEAVTRVPLIVRLAPAWHGHSCPCPPLASPSPDPQARVPMPLSPPLPPGTQVHEPVELVDLMPTLCSLAGLPVPGGVEGQDLSPHLVRGKPLDPHRPVFCEDYWNRMVTRNGWKLVFDMCHKAENVLFDLNTDPQSLENRYDDPDCLERRLDLKRVLLGFVMERLYGPYTQADVDRIEHGLADDHPTLSPVIQVSPDGIQYYRAAAVLNDDTHILVVPFYDGGRMRLFTREGRTRYYLTNRDAIRFDPAVADALVDSALKDCFPRLSSVSLFVHKKVHGWRCDHPRPTEEEATCALARAAGAKEPEAT